MTVVTAQRREVNSGESRNQRQVLFRVLGNDSAFGDCDGFLVHFQFVDSAWQLLSAALFGVGPYRDQRSIADHANSDHKYGPNDHTSDILQFFLVHPPLCIRKLCARNSTDVSADFNIGSACELALRSSGRNHQGPDCTPALAISCLVNWHS